MSLTEEQLQKAEASGDHNKIKAAGWVRAVRAAKEVNARLAEGKQALASAESEHASRMPDLKNAVTSAEQIIAPYQVKLDEARAAYAAGELAGEHKVKVCRATVAALQAEADVANKAAAGLDGIVDK